MTWYTSAPQNLTLNDVRNVLRETGLPYTRGSIPSSAVNTQVVTALPKSVDDRTQVFLKSGSTVDHYLYLKSIPGWVRLNDTVNQSIVTALPSAPSEGDQIVFDTGTAGVRWHLVYDTSDGTTYPWLFIGGSPLFSEVATSETTASTSYTALSTAGPAVTLPLAGDYMVTTQMSSFNNANTGYTIMSYDIGGTSADDADAIYMTSSSGANSIFGSVSGTRLKSGLTAVTLTSKYKVAFAGTGTFTRRRLSAIPVRVG